MELIGATKTASALAAPGLWKLNEQANVKRTTGWPTVVVRPQSARYWRLFITESYTLSSVLINELTMATSVGGNDITTGKTITTNDGYFPATYATDDNPASYWQTAVGLPAWLQIDFVTPVLIEEYSIFIGAYPTYAPKSWTLQTSNDAENWNDVQKVTNVPTWTVNLKRTYVVS